MAFQLKNIDRAIEWAIRDAFVKIGLWPDQRAYIIAGDQTGYANAIKTMHPKVDIFGSGNFTDREQLKDNNVIIQRGSVGQGDIGFSYPLTLKLQTNLTYNKIKEVDSTSDIVYTVRFVCFDVDMDRMISEILELAIGTRKYIFGMNDDLSATAEGFWIFKLGDPVDMSDQKFIERLYTFIVRDVAIEQAENVIETGIPPLIDGVLGLLPSKIDDDLEYPNDAMEIDVEEASVVTYFLSLVETLSGWKKLEIARMYAQETQAKALKDLIGRKVGINSGLTFTPFKGFYKSVSNEYLDTKFSPSLSDTFTLTNYTYMVFVTEPPAGTVMELFGLTDTVRNTSIFIQGSNSIGTQVKANSNTLLSDVNHKIKANTLYTITRRDRFVLEVFEDDVLILSLEAEPTQIPQGIIFDLNIANQAGAAIGTGAVGGLAFSAAGPGLKGREIRELCFMIRNYLQRIGLIMS